MHRFTLFLLSSLILAACSQNQELPRIEVDQPDDSSVLWYKQPATEWIEALPVGNGRFGAMVFGDPNKERLQLNEDSLWPAEDGWDNPDGTPEDLAQVRQLIMDGENVKADALFVEKFLTKGVTKSHQTMGDLWIDFGSGEYSNYKRSLDLRTATFDAFYEMGGSNIHQRVITSNPDNGIFMEYTAEGGNGLSATITMTRPDDQGHKTATSFVEGDLLVMQGEITQHGGQFKGKATPVLHGVKFDTRVKVKNEGGEVIYHDDAIELKGVKKASFYIVSTTSFYHDNYSEQSQKHLDEVSSKSFDDLLSAHVEDYQSVYNRMQINIANQPKDLPTDERLQAVIDGGIDVGLEELLFNYGRYLLISSSRPGSNPANLQGIWNKDITAPWNNDYHLNINLQMNYWPANITNMDELNEPLFDFIDKLVGNGKRSAMDNFGCRGAFIPHATDLWAPTFLRSNQAYWGGSMGGGGWLMQHYWQHYLFTQDEQFLRERAFPAIEQVAIFYSDWLMVDPRDGKLVSAPSSSPENSYINANGDRAALVMGSAKDQQVITEVFTNYLKAAEILGIQNEWTETIADRLENLRPGVRLGSDGRILEWDQEYEEYEPGHRHMSNLYAFHPSDQITNQKTPELVAAAKKTMEYRMEYGGGHTGWSRAWLINLQARFLDGSLAHDNILALLRKSMASNMFDLHPPFQIDGNFGLTAGVAEMLLQSHEDGLIRILPALSTAWNLGKAKGLKARGNITVDIEWQDSRAKRVVMTSPITQSVQVLVNGETKEVSLEAGKAFEVL